MVGNLATGYLQWMLWNVRNWCRMCENGKVQHTKYLKPAFLDTSIRPFFRDWVTVCFLNVGLHTKDWMKLATWQDRIQHVLV